MLNGNSRTAEKFVVRLPEGMRERIAQIANQNHRSMNSEIVLQLETLIDNCTVIHVASPLATGAEEIRALQAFRSLSAEKRKAMLTLLAGDQ